MKVVFFCCLYIGDMCGVLRCGNPGMILIDPRRGGDYESSPFLPQQPYTTAHAEFGVLTRKFCL